MKIQNTLSVENPTVKLVVAGISGSGKTTLAKTLQEGLSEKVLVISAEAGLLSLHGSAVDYVELQQEWDSKKNEFTPVPKIERIRRLGDIFKFVQTPAAQAKYKWLFIDSLTEISQAMLEAIEAQEEFQGPKNTIKKYGELSTRMMSMAKTFRDMSHYSVCFSALTKTEIDNDQQTSTKISVIGAFADRLPALFDEILFLGVTNEVGEDGRNKRTLLTQSTDRISFPKDRSGKLSRYEPADLSVIVKKIRAKPIVADISATAKQAHQAVKKAVATA